MLYAGQLDLTTGPRMMPEKNPAETSITCPLIATESSRYQSYPTRDRASQTRSSSASHVTEISPDQAYRQRFYNQQCE